MSQQTRAKPFDYAAFIEECRGLVVRARAFEEHESTVGGTVFKRWRLELEDLLVRVKQLKYSTNIHADHRLFYESDDSDTRADLRAFRCDLEDTLNEIEVLITRFDTYGDPASKGEDLSSRLDEAWANHNVVSLELQDCKDELKKTRMELRESSAALEATNRALESAIAKNENLLAAVDSRDSALDEREAHLVKRETLFPLQATEKVTWRWIRDNVSVPTLWATLAGAVVTVGIAFTLGVSIGGTKLGKTVIEWVTPDARAIPKAASGP